MSAFSDAWLSLREPLDAASRDTTLVAELVEALSDRPLAVTDLAAGTGSNLRYLAPKLGGLQHWRLIDHDAALLDAVPARLDGWARALGATLETDGDRLRVRGAELECHIERVQLDLARGVESIEMPMHSLVTASALLDLVSAPWLEALAARCKRAAATALFALTYDGRIDFDPEDADDGSVTALVNRHQRIDKGFGPALGPTAADRAADIFSNHGYSVVQAQSDWHIVAHDRALQETLLEDWTSAACAIAPDAARTVAPWAARRSRMVAAGSSVVVGHVDLLACPRDR